MGHQGSNISFKAVVWLALSFFVQFLLAQDTVVIQTSYGKVTGINQGSTYEFLGIPFAQAPVESLRFSPPEPWEAPSAPETYVQDATSFKAACVQILYPNFYEFPGQPSEDCLYLNIYTPASEQLNSLKLPVMVWIHGGAFTGGSATQNSFNGSIVASSHQVLVVTINYRLGVLGFVAEESLCDENSSCGFYGILDQQMALRWVQTNINSFGGDPANVTIFG
jgi:para-nitrobenzyl esterase